MKSKEYSMEEAKEIVQDLLFSQVTFAITYNGDRVVFTYENPRSFDLATSGWAHV
jgi:hypothetical protein